MKLGFFSFGNWKFWSRICLQWTISWNLRWSILFLRKSKLIKFCFTQNYLFVICTIYSRLKKHEIEKIDLNVPECGFSQKGGEALLNDSNFIFSSITIINCKSIPLFICLIFTVVCFLDYMLSLIKKKFKWICTEGRHWIT